MPKDIFNYERGATSSVPFGVTVVLRHLARLESRAQFERSDADHLAMVRHMLHYALRLPSACAEAYLIEAGAIALHMHNEARTLDEHEASDGPDLITTVRDLQAVSGAECRRRLQCGEACERGTLFLVAHICRAIDDRHTSDETERTRPKVQTLQEAEKTRDAAEHRLTQLRNFVFDALRSVVHKIEICGASAELTNAVAAAGDLACAVGSVDVDYGPGYRELVLDAIRKQNERDGVPFRPERYDAKEGAR